MECRVLFFFVIVSILPIVEMCFTGGGLPKGVKSSKALGNGQRVFLDPTGFKYLWTIEHKAYCKEVFKTPTPYQNNDNYNNMQVKLADEKGEVTDEEDQIDFFDLKKRRFFTCAVKEEISAFHAVMQVYESYDNRPIKKVFYKHCHLEVATSTRARITRTTFVPYLNWKSEAKDFLGKVVILTESGKTTK